MTVLFRTTALLLPITSFAFVGPSLYTRIVKSEIGQTRERTFCDIRSFRLSLPQDNVSKDDTSEDNLLEICSNEQDDDDVLPFSNTKMKTERHFLMKNVADAIGERNPDAADKAEEMIRQLTDLHERMGSDKYKPDAKAYNLLLGAHAKSGSPHAPLRIDKIIQHMQNLYSTTGDEDYLPDVTSYTAAIESYARSSLPNAAQEAERLLYTMMSKSVDNPKLEPTTVTCGVVLLAWARQNSKEAAMHAEKILERMESLRRSGQGKIEPNTHSFSTVIKAWARSGVPNGFAAERAEFILNRMIELSEENEAVKPNTVVFNTVIDAWSKSNDARAGKRSEALLKKMIELSENGDNDVRPDEISYNSVINAWARSGHVNSVKSAERVFEELLESGNANTVSYNSLLRAYSKQGDAEKATQLLSHMIDSYLSGESAKPDVISFTTVLDTLAKSKTPDKAQRTRAILDRMLQLYQDTQQDSFKPSTWSYNCVLNACAFVTPEEQRDAIKIAISTFTEMRGSDGITPDAISYGNVIKCISNLVPRGEVRTNMASKIFVEACKQGQVNDLVFNEIQRAVPKEVFQGLVESTETKITQVKDLPDEWTCNVANKKIKKPRGKTGKEREAEKQPQPTPTKKTKEAIVLPKSRNFVSEPSFESGRDV